MFLHGSFGSQSKRRTLPPQFVPSGGLKVTSAWGEGFALAVQGRTYLVG